MQDRLRQPRQDDEDGGDDEEASTQRVGKLKLHTTITISQS